MKMKYIRTENGIYEVVEEVESLKDDKVVGYDCIFNYCGGKKVDFVPKVEVIKQADTIEELCDKYIVDVTFKNKIRHHIIDMQPNKKKAYQYALKVYHSHFSKGYFYGAIWTDKGLIYVAKMNEKGCLELL